MTCDAFSDAILSGTHAPGLTGHLAGCAACRALAEGHAAALRLRGVQLSVTRPSLAPRLAAVAAIFLAVVGAAVALWPSPPEAPLPVVEQTQGPVPEQAPMSVERDGEGQALTALRSEVAALTRSDVTVEDETYRPFRAWPQWLAPSWSQAQGESQ